MSSISGQLSTTTTQPPHDPAPRRRRTAALLIAAAITLTGCSANNELAAQYRAGNGQNYIAGDGTVSEYAPGNRGRPVSFTGQLQDGRTVTSTDYAGNVLVVNFWYAGCPPCRVEAPVLQSLNEKYAPNGVHFLGVNLYDSAQTATSFEQDKGVTYPSVLDRETGSVLLAFAKSVPPKATPTTLVLDRSGRVQARILGAIPGKGILDSLIGDALTGAKR